MSRVAGTNWPQLERPRTVLPFLFVNPAVNDASYALVTNGASKFAFQTKKKSGTATTWTVKLQASLNSEDWEDIATHTEATTAGTVTRVTDKGCMFIRIIVTALGAGSLQLLCVALVTPDFLVQR